MIVGSLRCLCFIGLLICLILLHSFIGLVIWPEQKRLKFYLWSIQKISAFGLKLLNIEVIKFGEIDKIQNSLIVSNHLSYVDVLILASAYPSLFVTSTEIKETFMLGKICKLAGCFFVERRRSKLTSDIRLHELNLMKSRISQGFNVFLFPEGTSSNGSKVLSFKNSFFQVAVDCQIQVRPICLKYKGKNWEKVPWYGDMTFLDHLFQLCQQKVHAELIVLPEIAPYERTKCSALAYAAISEAYEKH